MTLAKELFPGFRYTAYFETLSEYNAVMKLRLLHGESKFFRGKEVRVMTHQVLKLVLAAGQYLEGVSALTAGAFPCRTSLFLP